MHNTEDERGNLVHRFKTFREEQRTADGFGLLRIHSLVKQTTDATFRIKVINKTVNDLLKLRVRLRSPRSRMRDRHRVEAEVEKILTKRTMEEFVRVEVLQEQEETLKQKTPGRQNAVLTASQAAIRLELAD